MFTSSIPELQGPSELAVVSWEELYELPILGVHEGIIIICVCV